MKVHQTVEEHLQDTYGAEMIFEEDAHEEDEEIQMKILEQAPPKFKDMQPQVYDPMEEVNLGTMEEPRIAYISSLLPSDFKEGIITTPQEFKDYFAWNSNEMLGLDRSLVEHRLPIKPEFHLFQ